MPQRVEPEVRVEVALVVVAVVLVVLGLLAVLLVLLVLRERLEPDDGGGVEGRPGGVLRHGVVDAGLEPGLVHDEVGVRDGGGLLDVELEVVRLATGPGEQLDVGVVARHPLGHERERVERGRHDDLAVGAAGVVGEGVAACGDQRETGEEGEPLHENDSQVIENRCQFDLSGPSFGVSSGTGVPQVFRSRSPRSAHACSSTGRSVP